METLSLHLKKKLYAITKRSQWSSVNARGGQMECFPTKGILKNEKNLEVK